MKNFNKLVKTECGITEKLEPLEAVNRGEFASTHRLFSLDLTGCLREELSMGQGTRESLLE